MGFVSAAAAYFVLGFAFPLVLLLTVALFNAFGNGVIRPALTSQITQVAGRTEQGIAIGISGSLSSFAMMLAPPTGGFLIGREWLMPWTLVLTGVALLGFFVAIASRRKNSALSSAP